jgi:hypothetical protein
MLRRASDLTQVGAAELVRSGLHVVEIKIVRARMRCVSGVRVRAFRNLDECVEELRDGRATLDALAPGESSGVPSIAFPSWTDRSQRSR